MITNNKVIQRTTPIIAPAMIPTDEPPSSLLPCALAAAGTVFDIDAIILLLVDNTVGAPVVVSLGGVVEVVGITVVVSLGGVVEVVGVVVVVSLEDVIKVVGVIVVVSLGNITEVV